jgi:hypothetical protein
MPKPFHELRERLLRAGVAPRHVRRYLAELADHFADLRTEEVSAGRDTRDAESAALARLGRMDDLANAMIGQRKFQSWCAPLALGAAYLAAISILWVLWRVFLPGADTPFGQPNAGPIYGFQNICFQADKFFYFGAPVLIGWGVAVIAARQRMKALWPIVGFVLVAVIGATNRVQAGRTAIPGGFGHIRMDFVLGTSVQDLYGRLAYAFVLLSITALPYLIWRFRKAHSLCTYR